MHFKSVFSRNSILIVIIQRAFGRSYGSPRSPLRQFAFIANTFRPVRQVQCSKEERWAMVCVARGKQTAEAFTIRHSPTKRNEMKTKIQ